MSNIRVVENNIEKEVNAKPIKKVKLLHNMRAIDIEKLLKDKVKNDKKD